MPLINLRSNLVNNQFGNDRPGYGSSGLPYIQTKIPSAPFSTGLYNPIYRPGSTGVLDYPIRGGGPGDLAVGQQTFTLSSQIDSIRIRKFLEDKSRGPAFIQKQIGLQLTNPKIETGNVLFGIDQSDPIPGVLENTRVYNNGRNTLAQIRAMGSGAHALRHGLVPFAAYQKHYYAIVNEQNVNNTASINRLVNLNELKMTTAVSPFVNPQNVADLDRVNTLGISLNRNVLFQYLGGPGSVYGAGSTTIRRVVDTTKLKNKRVMGYDLLKSQTINPRADGTAGTDIQDFRVQVFDQGEIDLRNPNERKVFAGRWTKEQSLDYKFYIKDGVNKIDKLNQLYPFIFENSQAPWEVESTKDATQDVIKFVFECISNDDPNYSVALFFRAFLTSTITDSNTAQLNSFKYAGRGENFYTYQGFDRTIGFSFRMAAGSNRELIPMYNRLNALVSQVYPDYSNNGIMRAPLVKLTIGDYIYRMPGFLENVNITVDNNYSWEINQKNTLAQLPQIIDVSVSFKPILSELPRRAYTRGGEPINSETSLETGNTSETYEVKNIPQIIANNNSVILSSGPQYTSTRVATQEEIRSQRIFEDTQAEIERNNRETDLIQGLTSLVNTNGVNVSLSTLD